MDGSNNDARFKTPNKESNAGEEVSSDDDTNKTPDNKDQSADEEGCINKHMPHNAIGRTSGADKEGHSAKGDGSFNANTQMV